MRCYFWKDEQTEILILDLLRAAAASCRSGSLSQHFTEGFAPRGYFKALVQWSSLGCSGAVLSTPCAPQALGQPLVPCPSCVRVNLQLHRSMDEQGLVCGLTLLLLFTTAVGKVSLFLSCFLCFCHQRRCFGNFLGCARVSRDSQAVLALSSFSSFGKAQWPLLNKMTETWNSLCWKGPVKRESRDVFNQIRLLRALSWMLPGMGQLSGQPVLVFYHTHHERFLPSIYSESTLF